MAWHIIRPSITVPVVIYFVLPKKRKMGWGLQRLLKPFLGGAGTGVAYKLRLQYKKKLAPAHNTVGNTAFKEKYLHKQLKFVRNLKK